MTVFSQAKDVDGPSAVSTAVVPPFPTIFPCAVGSFLANLRPLGRRVDPLVRGLTPTELYLQTYHFGLSLPL